MGLNEQAIGLFTFFPVLTTITLGLRIFVRTRLCKGAFGWDDVALLITWAGLILWVAFAWKSLSYEYGTYAWEMYTAAKNDVCYIISGTVKISVALVLYRLDQRRFIRVILITDMLICAIWTVVVTLILGVGCTANSPLALSDPVCEATNYAQEASYVVFNVFHVLIPIVILWGVHVAGNLKWAVVCLFAVGLLAAVAAIMKLQLYIQWYHPTPSTNFGAIALKSTIWAAAEHGLSMFAASVLAIRPFFTYVSKSLRGSQYTPNDASGRTTSLGGGSKSVTWPDTPSSAELGVIGVRNEVDVRSEYDYKGALQGPAYSVDVYNESTRRLVMGGKDQPSVGVSSD